MSLSVVLADAQPIVLEGLKSVLRRAQSFRVVAQCTTSEQTLRAIRKHRPDILVLDIHISPKSGFEILRTIARAKLTTRSVVFTEVLNGHQTLQLVRLGASGSVLKDAKPNVLVQCIRRVGAGENCFTQDSRGDVERQSLRVHRGHEMLTQRQVQIVRMVANGLRNNEIAKRLSIAEGTVQVHLHDIYSKLNLPHRLALALYARDIGLL